MLTKHKPHIQLSLAAETRKPLAATLSVDEYELQKTLADYEVVELDAHDLARGILAAAGPGAETKAAKAKALYEKEYSRPVYVKKLKKVLETLS